MDQIQVKVRLGKGTIVLEGPRDFVQEQVDRIAQLQAKGTPKAPAEPQADSVNFSKVSEKDLVSMKEPKGHHEIVAVLAFALTEQGNAEFTAEDIRRAYIRANVRPPKAVDQALRDAKNKFDYIQSGSNRGTYLLSPHGDRTVRFDLPRKLQS